MHSHSPFRNKPIIKRFSFPELFLKGTSTRKNQSPKQFSLRLYNRPHSRSENTVVFILRFLPGCLFQCALVVKNKHLYVPATRLLIFQRAVRAVKTLVDCMSDKCRNFIVISTYLPIMQESDFITCRLFATLFRLRS